MEHSMPMTEPQESHLIDIKRKFSLAIEEKYRRGQAQHGGNLWDRDVRMDIIDEAVDLFAYSITNAYKISQAVHILEQMKVGVDETLKRKLDEVIKTLTK